MENERFDTLIEDVKRDRIAKELRRIPEEKRTLKTLKDLHLEKVDTRINDIIKAEAVEWINTRGNCGMNINEAMKGDIIGWIKHFFNLTVEDINEENELKADLERKYGENTILEE